MIRRREPLTEKALRSLLERYETTYGVPTAELEQAFVRHGRLVETPEFTRWSTLRSAHELVLSRAH